MAEEHDSTYYQDRWDYYDDGPSECNLCGGKMISDWEGDPSVPGGTQSFVVCRDCGHGGGEPTMEDYCELAELAIDTPPLIVADVLEAKNYGEHAEKIRSQHTKAT